MEKTEAAELHPFYAYQLEILRSQHMYFHADGFTPPEHEEAVRRLSLEIYPREPQSRYRVQHVCERFVNVLIQRQQSQMIALYASYRLKFVQISELTRGGYFRVPADLFEDPEISIFITLWERGNQYIRQIQLPENQLITPFDRFDLRMMNWDASKQKLYNYESNISVQLSFNSVFRTLPFQLLASFGDREGEISIERVCGDEELSELYDQQIYFHFRKCLRSASPLLQDEFKKLACSEVTCAENMPNFWIQLGYERRYVFRRDFVNRYFLGVGR